MTRPDLDALDAVVATYQHLQTTPEAREVARRTLAVSVPSLLARVRELEQDAARRLAQVEHMLAHCKDAECMECGTIICQYGEPLHFHHDGCPACYFAEMEAARAKVQP